MLNDSVSPVIANCTFDGNTAASVGGGMYNNNNSPTVTNCTFSGNIASAGGGGMINWNGSPSHRKPTRGDSVSCRTPGWPWRMPAPRSRYSSWPATPGGFPLREPSVDREASWRRPRVKRGRCAQVMKPVPGK